MDKMDKWVENLALSHFAEFFVFPLFILYSFPFLFLFFWLPIRHRPDLRKATRKNGVLGILGKIFGFQPGSPA